MPYILLGIGTAIGLYGLYRFMLAASTKQIMAFFVVVIGVAVAIGVFYMTVTGRLLPIVGLLAALWPVFFSLYVHHKKKEQEDESAPKYKAGSNGSDTMTKEEALEVLGLDDNATKQDIDKAYKALVKKLHPDQDGSEWMTAKLNQARDTLRDA